MIPNARSGTLSHFFRLFIRILLLCAVGVIGALLALNNEVDARFRSVLTEQGDMSNISSHTVQREVTLKYVSTYLTVFEVREMRVRPPH